MPPYLAAAGHQKIQPQEMRIWGLGLRNCFREFSGTGVPLSGRRIQPLLPYLFGDVLGDFSIYSPKHFGSRYSLLHMRLRFLKKKNKNPSASCFYLDIEQKKKQTLAFRFFSLAWSKKKTTTTTHVSSFIFHLPI